MKNIHAKRGKSSVEVGNVTAKVIQLSPERRATAERRRFPQKRTAGPVTANYRAHLAAMVAWIKTELDAERLWAWQADQLCDFVDAFASEGLPLCEFTDLVAPALVAPAADGEPYPALSDALRHNPDRWGNGAIAGAMAVKEEGAEELSEEQWGSMLDELDVAVRDLMASVHADLMAGVHAAKDGPS
jgi:hypothetical protein